MSNYADPKPVRTWDGEQAREHSFSRDCWCEPRAEHVPASRTILVNAAPLARLLQKVDPGGFLSGDLGVCWVDDGSGFARKIEGLDREATLEEENAQLRVQLAEYDKHIREFTSRA